jgi:iron complex outermembrane receptor protein
MICILSGEINRFRALLMLGSAFLCSQALAQTAQTPAVKDEGLEEIVVTATKRPTNEQTTPQSIIAFSAADLEVKHITSVNDLAIFTPGLFIGADSGFGNTTTAIRGMGPINAGLGADEAVGVYIDGVYQGTPYGNAFTFIDVDQVEVLRGPQGTLYGRNATGGAILINTISPGPDTVIRADIGASQLGGFEGRALVSGPTGIDGLSGKIAIGETRHDGWATNPIDGEKLNADSNLNTSAGLRWTQGGIWDLGLNVHYGTENTTYAAKDANDGLPINVIPAEFPNSTDRTFGGATLNATAAMPWATLTGVAGYTNAYLHSLASSANVGLTELSDTSKASEFYEELRLASNGTGPISWIVGVTGLQQHVSDIVNFYLTPNVVGGNGLGLVFDSGLVTESYAGFAELGWQITDRVKLTAGDRYTRDKKDWSNCAVFGAFFTDLLDGSASHPFGCGSPLINESKTWTASTPKGVLDVKLTDAMFAYASFNKGFRSGGWNNTAPVDPTHPYSTGFDPEYAKSYETGLKSEFFDHRLRANVDAYLTKYTDLQVRTIDPVFHLLGVHNAASARAKGIELEVLAKPTSALTLGANAAWSRATYTSFLYVPAVGAPPVNYAGNFLNDAPEWMANLNAGYKFQLAGRGSLTPRIDASYQSHVYYTGANAAPFDGRGHEAINLHLRYDAASGPWGWDIYVNNVTDNQWRQYAYQGEENVVGASYALPRIVGVRLFWNH